jgi:hypothetical protein
MSYRICVTRKNGDRETELEIHRGSLPMVGDEVVVDLRSGPVKARVGSLHLPLPKEGGRVVAEVEANEI